MVIGDKEEEAQVKTSNLPAFHEEQKSLHCSNKEEEPLVKVNHEGLSCLNITPRGP